MLILYCKVINCNSFRKTCCSGYDLFMSSKEPRYYCTSRPNSKSTYTVWIKIISLYKHWIIPNTYFCIHQVGLYFHIEQSWNSGIRWAPFLLFLESYENSCCYVISFSLPHSVSLLYLRNNKKLPYYSKLLMQ